MRLGTGERTAGKIEPSGWLRYWWNHNIKHFFSTHMFPCVAYEGVRRAVSSFLHPIICLSWQSSPSSFLRKALGMVRCMLIRTAIGKRRGPSLQNKDAKEAVQLNRGNRCHLQCFRTSCLVSLHCSRNRWVSYGSCVRLTNPCRWLASHMTSLNGTRCLCLYSTNLACDTAL